MTDTQILEAQIRRLQSRQTMTNILVLEALQQIIAGLGFHPPAAHTLQERYRIWEDQQSGNELAEARLRPR